MTHQVHLQGVPRQHASALRRAVLRTLCVAQADAGALTLRLTDEDELRRLNAHFAGTDRPTDVLSFPDGEPEAGRAGTYFGDIVIALPVADAQARAAGHTVQAELTLLAIHGTLHLLGLNHADDKGRRAMWQRQDQILADLGCPIRSPQGET